MKSRTLVFSTDTGRLCPDCGQAKTSCSCAAADANAKLGDGRVRVSRESKGRGGKTVTLVTGLPLTAAELKSTGKTLKQLCGVGGAVQGAALEIQGDQVDKVLTWLKQQGYDACRSGG